ncbi:Dynactin subunit 4 [Wickerhamomyces ciferrii]|uniref:Dynactin subunit 4 n=1 Tax=Wickerhamomyces ciferrii (strain ATCC 14091 / BCRC 22168 / CBS 111 / JCM 3599 / NBRC 0793 / NRRL Y-1031 F-60-10) TaxID=1206466 RepID=K0KGB8_WICCF|nr:Dynactin subunit 4 [Wickerhamomyces ciferrii]CCH44205.1 Dynactin subunit 4 [Wickerhamomyces ciferrii]
MTVSIFCPCSEPIDIGHEIDPSALQLDSFPQTIIDLNTHHLLSNLNYCEHCQSIKCRKCIEPEVILKYCPKCLVEMKPDYSSCSKNCFDCPICNSNVSIHIQSPKIKNYKLKCLNSKCQWSWETGELEKSRALSRVAKSQINQTDEMQKFSKLELFYIQRKQILQGNFQIPKNITMEMINLKLNDNKPMDLEKYLQRDSITKLNQNLDQSSMTYLKNQHSNDSIINYKQSMKSIIPPKDKTIKIPPISTKLSIKTSKRCKACRNSLMKPDKEITSSKFYKLSNAIDYLPTIQIHNLENLPNRFLLSFQNPQSVKMEITISSYSSIPTTNHKVHLPITEILLDSKPDSSKNLENFVKSIPTVMLTRETKISRVELMNRSKYNFEYDVKEQGINWCCLPINIEFNSNELDKKIPIFITVKTEFYGLGYWAILDIEE